MMRFKAITLLVLLCALTACNQGGSVSKPASTQPVYDRIIESGTIRCGYSLWPPHFYIDSKTGEKMGIFYDAMEESGKRLNLKIEWVEEVGWGTVIEAVKSTRFDMACSSFWVNSTRARHVDFSIPLLYSTANIWMRSDDARIFKASEDLNNENIIFGALDGAAENKARQLHFPKAKVISLSELTSISEQLEGLNAGKYDAVIMDDTSIADYLKYHPGKLKKILPDHPVTTFPNVMMLPAGETQLKAMLDHTIREMHYDGAMAKIIAKHGALSTVRLPAPPYQEQK